MSGAERETRATSRCKTPTPTLSRLELENEVRMSAAWGQPRPGRAAHRSRAEPPDPVPNPRPQKTSRAAYSFFSQEVSTERTSKRSTRSSGSGRVSCPAPARKTEMAYLASSPTVSSPLSPLSVALSCGEPLSPGEHVHARLRSRARAISQEQAQSLTDKLGSPLRHTRASLSACSLATSPQGGEHEPRPRGPSTPPKH